jgi:hypothetical protein
MEPAVDAAVAVDTADYTDRSLRSLNQHSRVGIFTKSTSPRDEETKAEVLRALTLSVADANGSPRRLGGQQDVTSNKDDPFVEIQPGVCPQPVHSSPGQPHYGQAAQDHVVFHNNITTSPHSIVLSRMPNPLASVVDLDYLDAAIKQDKRMQSTLLARLTSTHTGFPTVQMALSNEYFPFMEGAQQAQYGHQYGVVKLLNLLITSRHSRFLSPPLAARSPPSSVATPRCSMTPTSPSISSRTGPPTRLLMLMSSS